MGQITLRIPDNILEKIQQSANEKKLTLTDLLILNSAPEYLENILTVNKVIDKISTIPVGSKFSLKSLYPIDVWTEFSTGSRISTGRLFFQSYDKNFDNLKSKIKFLGKNSANLAMYEKISDN